MGGGDVGAAFTATLKRIGTDLTSADLVKLYPTDAEASGPIALEECKFFDLFDADPAEVRQQQQLEREKAQETHGAEHMERVMMSMYHNPLKKSRAFDFRLEPTEKTQLAANGVVASQRMHAESFAAVYYRLYTDDMPVFVTTDSVLHAWHRSFDGFLVDFETKVLSPALKKVLGATLFALADSKSDGSTSKAVLDVELFLTMALSLLRGELRPKDAEKLGELWSAIETGATMSMELFSAQRMVDFSQFKPRGHYTKSEELKRYFRAMMWLGTVDFRIAGGRDQAEDLHQLQCAVLLVHFLQGAKSLDAVTRIDSAISSLMADGGLGADSLSPGQLARLVSPEMMSRLSVSANSDSDDGIQKLLVALQQQVVQKGLGSQLISGHPLMENLSASPTNPPTSFALFGQRFVWSAFIFSRLVYDHVLHEGAKQKRRIPSAVDVAFTLFGNDVAAGELADRMEAQASTVTGTEDFVAFRDGIPMASNLVALRQVIDQEFDDDDAKSESADEAEGSISSLWLRALRALSRPSPNAARTFHSGVWKQRQMNTQLASFTQLRHDSVLYSKQGYSCRTLCEYADGMVDPYPLFWRRMRELAERMTNLIGDVLNSLVEPPDPNLGWRAKSVSGSFHMAKAVRFFDEFASIMTSLEEIAVCQAESRPLSEPQVAFVKTVMEERFGSGSTQYSGWYPSLFYESSEDSGKRDVLVVDVHTDSPSVEHGDPGGVLHLGVGDPLVGFFVVNNVMYAGPVFSSYEFVTPIDMRLTDDEFKERLPTIRAPHWARRSYLSSERSINDEFQAGASASSAPRWSSSSRLR
ncbi:hypothetical protein BBJ28_00002767 [Nothophytophthora sp. Chile5]|nr:hypothetical protein BBJ28_00002767 [Nothophytophthora sp. Chile5]